jgi:uncharacterized protein with HEPN domain
VSKLDFSKLELILRMIAHLERRLSRLSRGAFLADVDEIDLTAFRLMVIGETSAKLSDELKLRNPHIDWPNIYGMRNVIAHDYDSVVPERLWAAYTGNLAELAATCREELAAIGESEPDV